jgi:hypothetical protein
MVARHFPLSRASDAFIDALCLYGQTVLKPVFIGGLSALTRMAGAPPPPFEYVVLAEDLIDDFVTHVCNQERCEVLSLRCLCVAVADKPAYLCTPATFPPVTNAPIEMLVINVCDGAVHSFAGVPAIADFDARTVRYHANPAVDPTCYWKSFMVASYLPGFTLPRVAADPREICGCVSGSPLYRFTAARPGGLTTTTFGGRVLSEAVLKSVANVNFPIGELFRLSLPLFNADMFPGFTRCCTEDMCSLVSNYETNMSAVGVTDLAVGRFASLVYPLIVYTQFHPREGARFMAANSVQADFEGFADVPTHNASLSKCPLAFWFWSSRHNIRAILVLRAVDIYAAYRRLAEKPDPGRWLFVDAPACWREALALLDPPACRHRFSEISRHPSLRLLENSEFAVPQEALSGVFRSVGRFAPRQMRDELYSYISSQTDPTWAGFCASVQHRARGYSMP